MKKTWAIRKDAKAVSPVIATILMVAITVVLAAVLYVMVLGFNTTGGTAKGVQIARTWSSTLGGYQFTLTPTEALPWDQVTVIIQYGGTSGTWSNLTTIGMTGAGVMVEHRGAPSTAVDGSKFLNATDLGGNGEVNTGDYITITGSYTTGHQYKVILLYKQDQSQMGSVTWTH
jgi:flagellin-like protein